MRLSYSRYALPKAGLEPKRMQCEGGERNRGQGSERAVREVHRGEGGDCRSGDTFGYAGITVEKKIDETKGWAGVSFAPAATDSGHAKISNIIPGSPAESGGAGFWG